MTKKLEGKGLERITVEEARETLGKMLDNWNYFVKLAVETGWLEIQEDSKSPPCCTLNQERSSLEQWRAGGRMIRNPHASIIP